MPAATPRLLASLHSILTVILAAGAAAADPARVPVLAVGTADASPTDAQLASVVSAVGAPARSGATLSDELLARFGVVAPDDALAGVRAEVDQARAAYVSDGRDRALQRMSAAAQHFEAPAGAQSLRLLDDDRRAYETALARIAQWQLDRRNAAEAERALRRLLTFDEAWVPGDAEPPPVHALAAQVRAAMSLPPVTARATIVVDVPSAQCSVRVDGQTQPLQGTRATASVVPGEHRVTARCAQASRVRVLRLATGASESVTVDPRLDAALRTDAMPGLRYASSTDMASSRDADLAAIGAALGARRVVGAGVRDAVLIDVAGARSVGQTSLDAQLDAHMAALLEGPRAPTIDPVRSAAPAARVTSGPGAGPWILVGAGVVGLGLGAYLFAQRGSGLDDLSAVCPRDGEGFACSDTLTDAQVAEANDARDRANLATAGAIAATSAGAVLLTSGLLWYFLAPRREVAPMARAVMGGRALGLTVSF